MGRVDSFEIAGLELWFNSDDHLPPHFHVERPGTWEAVVRFLRDRDAMLEVRWGTGPRGRERKQLLDLAERHREGLLREWESKSLPRTPGELK